MENKCKIVQDLLPTYIESLTSDESVKFIEAHLNSCNECKKIYDNMKESLENEEIENTEIIKKIKKYKKRIRLIKSIFILAILALPIYFVGNTAFEFYVIRNAYAKNTNYRNFESFTMEEYVGSIEAYEKHYTTYYLKDTMKKFYGNDLIEYYDGETHYFFNNENMTYWMKKENINTNVDIDISILNGTENIIKENGKISNFEILKFVLFQNNLKIIANSEFRQKPYYLVVCDNDRIYLDQDTFYAERIIEDDKNGNREKNTEYRITTTNVNWRDVKQPDFSKYTLIEN